MAESSKRSLGSSIDTLLHLPPGTMGNSSKIEMIGNRELSVEGCKGVLEYDESIIRLNLGNRQLKVLGRNLSIRVLERNYSEIEGFITNIEFM